MLYGYRKVCSEKSWIAYREMRIVCVKTVKVVAKELQTSQEIPGE
jgi:hypothetical protein